MNNKKGSVSVFLIAILFSMVLVIGFMVESSSGRACRSFGEGVMTMGAESILTEYNRALKDNYGLFAFLGEKNLLESRFTMYSEKTFNKNNRTSKQMDLLRLKLNHIAVDLGENSITNFDIFEGEIKKYMSVKSLTMIAEKIASTEKSLSDIKQGEEFASRKSKEALELESSIVDIEKGEDGEEDENAEKVKNGKKKLKDLKAKFDNDQGKEEVSKSTQILKDDGVIYYLPSQNNEEKEMFWDFSNPAGKLVTNSYILISFNNNINLKTKIPTFYKNEVEYILIGNLDDNKNLEAVKRRLMVMRTGLNMSHIYSNPEKLRQLAAAATALTPGPWAAVTQIILAGIWSGAESMNDLKLLEEGKKVPILKQDKEWAISLKSILEGQWGEGSIGDGGEGLDYEGYLAIMLTVAKRSDTLLRTMDLIQINIKGNYDQTFILKNYYTGFLYKCELEKDSGFFGLMGKGVRLGDIEGEIKY